MKLRFCFAATCLLLALPGGSLGSGAFAFACPHPSSTSPTASQPSSDATQPEPIGSLRNARIAYPIPPGGEKPNLTLLCPKLPESELAELRRLAPNLTIIDGLNRDSALKHVTSGGEAHAVHAALFSPALLDKAPNLVWVHAPSAGVEWLVGEAGGAVGRGDGAAAFQAHEKVVLTNSRAVHAPAIADHAMAMLLTLSRNLRPYAAAQAQHRWLRDAPPPAGAPAPFALQGKTMLIVGLGGIGTEIAQRAHAFGMKITATRRTDTPAPAGLEYITRIGKPADLLAMLPDADVVAICVPLTPETTNLFNREALAAMKPGSILINISRGKVIDTGALVEALKPRASDPARLAGACLDVTDPEPLPPDHPLWTLPNVIITPHVSSESDLTDQRRRELFAENVRRFASGEPLLNVVDIKAGY